MAAPQGIGSDVAGYAPITRDRGGRIAFVFGDRVGSVADRAAVARSRVLALVIAHEIAHLLMPARSHSSDGLMRARWGPEQFRRLANQHFTREEVRDIFDMAGTLSAGWPKAAD
jgi:hypothetical protein